MNQCNSRFFCKSLKTLFLINQCVYQNTCKNRQFRWSTKQKTFIKRFHKVLFSDIEDLNIILQKRPVQKIWTIQTLNRLKTETDICEQIKNWFDNICKRWICMNDWCRNIGNYCWINYECDHYIISVINQHAWNLTIIWNNITIENSFVQMMNHWMKNKMFNKNYKCFNNFILKQKFQFIIQSFMKMIKQQMKINMMKQWNDNIRKQQNHQNIWNHVCMM